MARSSELLRPADATRTLRSSLLNRFPWPATVRSTVRVGGNGGNVCLGAKAAKKARRDAVLAPARSAWERAPAEKEERRFDLPSPPPSLRPEWDDWGDRHKTCQTSGQPVSIHSYIHTCTRRWQKGGLVCVRQGGCVSPTTQGELDVLAPQSARCIHTMYIHRYPHGARSMAPLSLSPHSRSRRAGPRTPAPPLRPASTRPRGIR